MICEVSVVGAGRGYLGRLKRFLGAKRISVGSVFWRETNFGREFWEKLIVCWNFECLCEKNE